MYLKKHVLIPIVGTFKSTEGEGGGGGESILDSLYRSHLFQLLNIEHQQRNKKIMHSTK